MGPAGLSLSRILQSKRAVAAIVVTVVTILLAGGVVAVTTTLACSPARGLGLKLANCGGATDTAAHLPPNPTYYPAKGNQPPSPYYIPPPYTNPPSNFPPYDNPASSYPPTSNPGATYPPFTFPNTASGSAPADPFFPAASGSVYTGRLSCSLPMYAGAQGGGFVVFPQGNFVADPRSAVALPTPSPGGPSPAINYASGGWPGPGYGGMGGYRGYGIAWDPAHKRWLPVKSEMAAPDGNHYAYPSTNSIYLVDAATNTQVELGTGHPWIVIRVLNDRVYAADPNTPGFWVVPFSGTPRQVTAQGYWQEATATAAYGALTFYVPPGATSKIVKLDVASGAITDWFAREGFSSWVYGFDLQDDPIIFADATNGWNLWLTKSPTSGTVITNSLAPVSMIVRGGDHSGAPFADSKGIWFSGYFEGGGPGVGLYVAGSGFYWMAFVGGVLAGACA